MDACIPCYYMYFRRELSVVGNVITIIILRQRPYCGTSSRLRVRRRYYTRVVYDEPYTARRYAYVVTYVTRSKTANRDRH